MDDAPPVSKLQRQTVSDIVKRCGLVAVGEPKPVEGSLLNENFRVESDAGPRFARIYRKNLSKEDVAAEHALTTWAAAEGLPAPVPIRLDNGKTAATMSRRQVALFPWVDGRMLARGEIDEGSAAALGELQGRVHSTLSGYDGDGLRVGGGWDAEASYAALRRVVDLINFNPRPTDADRKVTAAIQRQLAVMESAEARPYSDFDHLARQAVHGDFQERNVLFDKDTMPVALVDWELAHRRPRALALLRAVTYMGVLDEPMLGPYLRGYGKHVTLLSEECADAVEMWWQTRIHGTWIYTARYIEGMRGLEGFIESTAADFERFLNKDFRVSLADTLVRCTAGN